MRKTGKIGKTGIAAILSMAMIASLTGCGGIKTTEDQTTAGTATAGTTAAASESAAAESNETEQKETKGAAEGQTEVTFWHSLNGSAGEALEEVIANYNDGQGREKGIHVNLVYQGYEGTDKVILAYQTGDKANAPDINQGLTSTIPGMMDLDWTVDLTEMIKEDGNTVKSDDFYEAMIRSCTADGKLMAVPFANSNLLLYYNEDALKEAGFDAPPKTWDELALYTEKLTKKGADGTVERYGFETQIKRYQLVNYIVQQSENSFVGDNEGGRAGEMTKLTIGEDNTLKTILEKVDAVNKTGGYKFVEDSLNEEFANGLTTMCMMSSSRLATVGGLVGDSFNWKVAPIPKVTDQDTSGAAIGGSCLTLFNLGDENRVKAAWDVLQYCSSPEAQYILSTKSGYIPVNKAVEEMADMKAYYEANPQFKVPLDQMKASSPLAQEPLDLVYNDINGVMTDIMVQFCEGSLTVDETVDKIVNECNALLDEYHEAND